MPEIQAELGVLMEWVLGFVTAVVLALTGMGAGSFTVPVLILSGLPTVDAVGTAIAFGGILRLIVAPFYLKSRHVHLRCLGLLGTGAIPGLLIGIWILHKMANWWKSGVLMFVGLFLVFASCVSLARRTRARKREENYSWQLVLLALPIGMETGFSSAGAGALGTTLLLNCTDLSAAKAIGTDICFGIILAMVGTFFHMGWGSINRGTLLWLLAGGVPGAIVGCTLAGWVSSEKLRVAVAVIAIVLGLQLIVTAGHSLF